MNVSRFQGFEVSGFGVSKFLVSEFLGFGVSRLGQTTEDRRQRIWLEDASRNTAAILCPLSFVFCPFGAQKKIQISSCGQIRNMINC